MAAATVVPAAVVVAPRRGHGPGLAEAVRALWTDGLLSLGMAWLLAV